MHLCKTAAVRSCDQLTFRQKYFSTRGQWTIKLPHTWTKRLSSKLACVCVERCSMSCWKLIGADDDRCGNDVDIISYSV